MHKFLYGGEFRQQTGHQQKLINLDILKIKSIDGVKSIINSLWNPNFMLMPELCTVVSLEEGVLSLAGDFKSLFLPVNNCYNLIAFLGEGILIKICSCFHMKISIFMEVFLNCILNVRAFHSHKACMLLTCGLIAIWWDKIIFCHSY